MAGAIARLQQRARSLRAEGMPLRSLSPASVVRSSAPAPDLNLQIISEIIEAERDATTFPAVFAAYTQVLRNHDIETHADEIYFPFVLKLGSVKRLTWGERWDQWLEDHPGAMERSLQLHGSQTLSSSTSSQLSRVKDRVPFLAEAAEADDAYEAEDEEDARNFLQALDQHATDSEVSRSFVGYTPSQSEADASFQPPERTSTPVYPRSRHASAHPLSPALPPSPLSDGPSQSPQVKLPRSAYTPIRAPSMLPAKLKITREEEVRVAELKEEALLEMEGRAIAFFQTGLVGRCFETWARQADWVMTTSAQVQQARNNILLRQCLHVWRDLLTHHERLPGIAERHRTVHLQCSTLKRWKTVLKQRRMQDAHQRFVRHCEQRLISVAFQHWRSREQTASRVRWEAEMSMREMTVVERLDAQVVANAFTHWKDRHQTNKAIALHDLHAMQRVLDHWRYAAVQSQHLRATLLDYEQQREDELLDHALATWRKKTALSQAAAVVESRVDWRRAREALVIWKRRKEASQRARIFDQRRVLSLALVRWGSLSAGIRKIDGVAVVYRMQRDALLLRSTLSVWMAAEKGRLLERVRETRLLRSSFASWKTRRRQVQVLEDQASTFVAQADVATKSTALIKWRATLDKTRHAQIKADKARKVLLLQRALGRWQKAASRVASNQARAEVARVFFVQRSVVACWRERLAERRQQRWAKHRKLQELKGLFDAWRSATALATDLRERCETFTAERGQQAKAAGLQRWTARIIAIKSRELDVSELRDRKLQKVAFVTWTQACIRHGEALSLMHSFIDVKQDDALRGIFGKWHHLAVHAKERRVRAAKREEDKNERLIADAFLTWRSAYQQRKLEPQLGAVMLRHEDALLFRVFDLWKAKSHRLPAVSFELKRVKTLAWKKWKEALPRRRLLNEAVAADTARLLSDSLRRWREARLLRVARTAAARHRNVLAAGSVTRIRPSSASDVRAFPSRARPVAPASATVFQGLFTPAPRRRVVSPSTSDPTPSLHAFTPAHARLRSELATSTTKPEPEPTYTGFRRGSDLYQELAGKIGGRSGGSLL